VKKVYSEDRVGVDSEDQGGLQCGFRWSTVRIEKFYSEDWG
jgi:hypothetical protein